LPGITNKTYTILIMNMAKSFSSSLNKSILSVLLLFLPFAFLLTFVFSQPEPVKSLIRDSSAYSLMSKVAIDTTVTTIQASGQISGFSREMINRAAKKAFLPTDMRTKGETVIDELYAWLNGKQTTFQPKISIESNKQAFSKALADETIQAISVKPICSYEQLQNLNPSDPNSLLLASCQPPLFNADNVRAYFTNIMPEASQKMQQTNPTLSQLSESQNGNVLIGSNPLATSAPVLFGVLKYSFFAVISFVIISLLFFWLLYRRVADYSRVIFLPFFTSGVFLVIYSLIGRWLVDQNFLASVFSGTQPEITQELIKPFATIGLQTSLWFGGIYIILSLVFFGAHRTLRQRNQSTLPRVNETPLLSQEPPRSQNLLQ